MTTIENDARFALLAAQDPDGGALVAIAVHERAEDDARAEFEQTGRPDRGRLERWIEHAIARATASTDAWIGARAAGAIALRRSLTRYMPRWLDEAATVA